MDAKGLAQYADQVYKATIGLMKMAPPDKLNWKPKETGNWLTLGQLLQHLSDSTGAPMKMFITGEWPQMPEGTEMIPPAEKMPTTSSVDAALKTIEADRAVMHEQLERLPDAEFRTRLTAAPWAPMQLPLWVWLLQMVEHQLNHKMMLFTYLKLLGIKVGTAELYGM
jgi:uncharacterized damage-inducible protein DinB